MKIFIKYRREISIFFLVLMSMQTFPLKSHAVPWLNNTPYLEVSEWVDLFTGDVDYTISLLDVPVSGGIYPISLNYKSGSYDDIKSGWVGLGWDISIGRIERKIEGVADEFYGDSIQALHVAEPVVTVGVGAGVNQEVLGKRRGLNRSDATHHLNFYQDSRHGVGYTLEGNMGYNRLFGSCQETVSYVSGPSDILGDSRFSSLSLESYHRHGGTPNSLVPVTVHNTTYPYTFKAGHTWSGVFSYGYIEGFYNLQTLKYNNEWRYYPAFGALHSQLPMQSGIVTDVLRQQEPKVSRTSDLPVSRMLNDRFILRRDGNETDLQIMPFGSMALPHATHHTSSITQGDETTGGSGSFMLKGTAHAGPWRDGNSIGENLKKVLDNQPVIRLENIDDLIAVPTTSFEDIRKDPLRMFLEGQGKNVRAEVNVGSLNQNAIASGIRKAQPVQVLTNEEILNSGDNEVLPELHVDYRDVKGNQQTLRRGEYPKHHWAAITTLRSDGQRCIYGLPSYVQSHEQVIFSGRREGKTSFVVVEENDDAIPQYAHPGKASFLSYVKTPQYPEAFLLTAVLGSDYVDLSNDGVTADDLGYWVKFSYKKATAQDDLYKCRTPFTKAYLIEGNSSEKDDKGTYSYIEKDLWYLDQIETSTHIVKFITEERLDGYGAAHKIQNTPALEKPQHALKEIRMYSKELGQEHPVRVVKMEYDYSLYNGLQDSKPGNGKLTLRKLWFEGYENSGGKNNAFQFDYVGNREDTVGPNDERGTSDFSEGPLIKNENAWAYGNLSSLKTPTGRVISFQYEPDDYAYVQHLEAQEMVPLVSDDLIADNNLKVTFNVTSVKADNLSDNEQRQVIMDYLGSQKEVSYRIRVNLLSEANNEFVNVEGRASVDFSKAMGLITDSGGNYTSGYFYVLPENNRHPFSIGAWNHLVSQASHLIGQPGKLFVTDKPLEQKEQIERLAAAASGIRKVYENFYEHCDSLGWGRQLDSKYCSLRLNSRMKAKRESGCRVKQITMMDEYSGDQADISGYWFEYTMEENGQIISSGVASNEALVSTIENPLFDKFPQWSHVYPSATVGYSQVRVYSLASGMLAGKPIAGASYFPKGENVTYGTRGMSTYEFYTAREYPTVVFATGRDNKSYADNDGSGSSKHHLVASQAYKVLTNDMHGKSKKVSSYRQYPSGEFSKTPYAFKKYEYFSSSFIYDSKMISILMNDFGEDEEKFLDPRASDKSFTLGQYDQRLIDLYEASQETWRIARQDNVNNLSLAQGTSSPSILLKSGSSDLQHTSATFKTAVYQRISFQHGMINKTLSFLNGSVDELEALKFDKSTGQATTYARGNGHNVRSFEQFIPAYHRYAGMGPASLNLGKTFTIHDVREIGHHVYMFTTATKNLQNGDELVLYSLDENSAAVSKATIVDDRSGRFYISSSNRLDQREYDVKVVRSGYRNLLDAPGGKISTTSYPSWKSGHSDKSKDFVIPK